MRGRSITGTLFLLVLVAAEWRVILTVAVVQLATAVGLRVVFARAQCVCASGRRAGLSASRWW